MNETKSKLAIELEDLIGRKFSNDEVASAYLERIKLGNLTKKENSESHLCTYFAPYDPVAKQVFIGHHKKAGIWLFNGGHIDEGETLRDTLKREIDEEWGLDMHDFEIEEPGLLTFRDIYNPTKQPCLWHFDIWHFIPVDKNTFNPDKEKLAEEFHECIWVDLDEARKLFLDDESSLKAIKFIEENLF
jgi:8-oxo-dGTP pyrophosphatase MutT (NUDIX family)